MKLYDWKRRTADETAINDVENFEFTLDNLRSAPGSRKAKTRKGRGIAAGQGATCGFGMRGQKSRGGNPTRPGFEGGQNPLYRRLPKFVGQPTGPGHTKTIYNIIKLDQLNGVASGSTCTCESKRVFRMDGLDEGVFAYHCFILVFLTRVDCFNVSVYPCDFNLFHQIVDSLLEASAVTKSKYPIHKVVVGREDFTAKSITVQAHAFTKAAQAAIEGAGGKCELLKRTTGEVITA
jgi:large subunit ribosomal protein L15